LAASSFLISAEAQTNTNRLAGVSALYIPFTNAIPYGGDNGAFNYTSNNFGGSNYWLGFSQAEKLGYKIKKGSKATTIYLWTNFDKEETNEDTGETTKRKIWYMKPLKVFNIKQCENVPDKPTFEHNPIPVCEGIITDYSERKKPISF